MFMFEQEQENPLEIQHLNGHQLILRQLSKKKNLLHTTLSSLPPTLCYLASDDNQPDSSSNYLLKTYYSILLSSVVHRYFFKQVHDDLMNAITGFLLTAGYIELFSNHIASGLLIIFIAIRVNRFANAREHHIIPEENFNPRLILEGVMLFAYTLTCAKYTNNKIFRQHEQLDELNLEQDMNGIYSNSNGIVHFPEQQIDYSDDASQDHYHLENNKGPT